MTKNLTCKEIIQQYLEKKGYDGLCNPYAECGCDKDNLFLCDSDFQDCQCAYKRKMTAKEKREMGNELGEVEHYIYVLKKLKGRK